MIHLTLEADPSGCGHGKPCPKIWGVDDDTVFVQGKLAPAEILTQLGLPADDTVAEFPRQALLEWAARQLGGHER